jgi:hypothetical protein
MPLDGALLTLAWRKLTAPQNSGTHTITYSSESLTDLGPIDWSLTHRLYFITYCLPTRLLRIGSLHASVVSQNFLLFGLKKRWEFSGIHYVPLLAQDCLPLLVMYSVISCCWMLIDRFTSLVIFCLKVHFIHTFQVRKAQNVTKASTKVPDLHDENSMGVLYFNGHCEAATIAGDHEVGAQGQFCNDQSHTFLHIFSRGGVNHEHPYYPLMFEIIW